MGPKYILAGFSPDPQNPRILTRDEINEAKQLLKFWQRAYISNNYFFYKTMELHKGMFKDLNKKIGLLSDQEAIKEELED